MTIKIMNEFLHSPIWTYGEDGIITDDLSIIENDDILQKLSQEAIDMYSGYYEFDSHDVPCWFNSEKEKAEKEEMLGIIGKIVSRLNEINDGSYVVEDLETPRLLSL
jgi:hypothetical protein